jgi:antitoxin MazE
LAVSKTASVTASPTNGIFFIETSARLQMKIRVQKWGNSLAVRIPKAFAIEVHLKADALVDLSLADGKLVLQPVEEDPIPTLDELLARITPENLHAETDWGPPMGRETW